MHSRRKLRIETGRAALALTVMLMVCAACAGASSATLFLEEPYGTLGFFTPTGHAAVYLSGVCAASPLVLRRCKPGETGVVISRYDGVQGYDWIAIPLIPYLYAVNRAEDIPLFADAKMVASLRDRYRRHYLEDVIPNRENGDTPSGNWYELVGSSYDRTIYGFEIDTTPAQDLALIRKLNASPNVSHFHLSYRNCADFAKDIINFYYPKALHRSIIADIGMSTPKQMAKRVVKFNQRHPEIHYSRLVIAQVPGSLQRSFAPKSVVQSFFTSKKYIVPSAVLSPIFAGCIFAVYVGTGASRFEPARDAMVYAPGNIPALPLDHEAARAYQHELKDLMAEIDSPSSSDKAWSKLQSKAVMDFDDLGRPVLLMEVDGRIVSVGATAGNVLKGNAPPQLVRQLLEARLQSELRGRAVRGLSEDELSRDWYLLRRSMSEEIRFEQDGQVAAHSAIRSDNLRGQP